MSGAYRHRVLVGSARFKSSNPPERGLTDTQLQCPPSPTRNLRTPMSRGLPTPGSPPRYRDCLSPNPHERGLTDTPTARCPAGVQSPNPHERELTDTAPANQPRRRAVANQGRPARCPAKRARLARERDTPVFSRNEFEKPVMSDPAATVMTSVTSSSVTPPPAIATRRSGRASAPGPADPQYW